MPRPNYAETLIGAAVVAAAVVIAALAYYRTGMGGTSGYEVNARLAKVDDTGALLPWTPTADEELTDRLSKLMEGYKG